MNSDPWTWLIEDIVLQNATSGVETSANYGRITMKYSVYSWLTCPTGYKTMIPKTRSIRRVIIVIGALIPLTAGCSTVKWEHDYKKGVKRAAQMRKRVLLQFHSNINPDCMDMERKVFTDPEVQKLMGEYVAVRLDYLLNKQLADDLDVQIVPTFLILRHDGVIVGSHVGKMDETKFKYFLIKHRYN